MIYLVVIFAWVAHIASKLLDAAKKHKEAFSLLTWFSNPVNYLYLLMTAIIIPALIISINYDAIQDVIVYGIVFKIKYVFAICIGWMPASILHAIIKKAKK